MTRVAAEVELCWLAGLGSCPGAADLRAIGPLGPIAKAVTLPEALAVSAMIDLLCPASNWHQAITLLAARSTEGRP